MRILSHIARFTIFLALFASVAPAQEPGSAAKTAAELIAQEKLRSRVEQAFAAYIQPADRSASESAIFVSAALQLVETGPAVEPYVINELEHRIPNTFFLCAYTLGLLNTADGEIALRKAIEQAEQEKGSFALYRKAWAAMALGLMGKSDALLLLDSGEHKAGLVSIYSGWTALETIALHTYPESIPRLYALLDLYAEDAELRPYRAALLQALWHLADPSTVPKLKEVMQEADPLMRMEAARALGLIDRPEALAAAHSALGDEAAIVRRSVALSLSKSGADIDIKRILARLEAEDDTATRRSLYELAARQGGPRIVADLAKHWGREAGGDRAGLLEALGFTRSAEALPTIKKGINDRDGRVIMFATKALAAINSEGAVDLLIEGVSSDHPVAEQESLRVLRELGVTRAAPAIAERLVKVALVGTERDVRFRPRAQALAETLVDLGHHKALDDLRKARARQTDALVVASLDRVIGKLEAIKENGRNTKKWIAAMASKDKQLRLLAYARLGEIGGASAARALAATFGRVDPDEGAEILSALGGINDPAALELIERVLLAPEFDTHQRAGLRDMAAWGARKLGGDRMVGALRKSIKRRQGRDVLSLIYLALIDGDKALPVLAEYRLSRTRYVSWFSGRELEKLDWLRRHISAGRPLDAVDLPPGKILFK